MSLAPARALQQPQTHVKRAKDPRLQVPLYMAAGMASKAAALYNTLLEWCSPTARHAATADGGSAGPFTAQLRVWSHERVHDPGPCVLFATPAMLHGGVSLRVFREWAPEKGNLVVLPSHCTSGTVGNMLMAGVKKGTGKVIQLDAHTEVHVRCQVRSSAGDGIAGSAQGR